MDPALLKLIFLQGRGMLRRTTRGAGTVKRILFFSLGAVVFVAWLLSALAGAFVKGRSNPDRVRAVMPLALLGICVVTTLTSAGDKAVAFTPGEVDQLFPGPFSRRQLLAYKLLKGSLGAVLTALILSVVLLQHARWWPACFVGVFLALLFVQFFSIAVLLAGQTLGARAYTRARQVIMVLALAGALFAVKTWAGLGADTSGVQEMLDQIHASPVGRFVLAPLDPFGRAMTATTAPALFKQAAYASALVGASLVLVILLDANYLEAAMVASQRRYEKIQRIRAGSFLSGVGVSKTARWRLPAPPWAGGAGPVAWRQATHAARSSRGLLLLLLMVAIASGAFLSSAHQNRAVGVLTAMGVWLTFLASGLLNFDFRGDVDQMDTLKALPIRGVAMTLGQLAVPVLVMASLHLLVLGAAALLVPVGQRPRVLAAMTLALPFDTLLFGAENLIFLLFPSRPAAASPGDLQILGRKFVFLLMKSVIVIVGVSVAGALAILVWVLTGKSLAALTTTAWLVLAAESAALIPLVAWAYDRFDPSIDTPA